MSCKILHNDESHQPQPLALRRVGELSLNAPASAAGVESSSPLQARIAQLESEAARREQEARQAGYSEAEAALGRGFQAEVEAILQRQARGVEELLGARRNLRRQMEGDMVRFSLAIARRVLHRELTVDPEALVGIVKAALESIEAREVHRLRVYVKDAPLMERKLESLRLPGRVEVVPDPQLERGGLVFETARGTLDASVDTQLEEIDRGLADLLRRRT